MGPFAAAAAGAAALLGVVGGIYQTVAREGQPPDDFRELAAALDADAGVFVVAIVIQAVSYLALPLALAYYYRVIKFRRPEMPTVALVMALAGPLLLAVAGILSQLDRIDLAREFLASGPRTEDRAEDLLTEPGFGTYIGLPGALILGFALVLLNVSAMRAGVVSRFIGVIGVIVGVLPVLANLLPIGGPGFVQIFWLGALALLFLGRWPGGRGPTWETGEATPWPSAAQRRAEAAGDTEAASIPADDPTIEPDAPRDEPAGDASDPRAGRQHPASRKRKRKRRR